MKKAVLWAFVLNIFLLMNGGNYVNATTIYTSLPDRSDQYYQPFQNPLLKFNQDLQTHADNSDDFRTIVNYAANLNQINFYYPDIWIRDVAPVETSRLVKFKYSPSYLKKVDSKYLDDRFNKFLASRYNYEKSDLIVDGGNIQWNGTGTIILTKQVFHDNPKKSKREIISELRRKLAVKHVIFISKEPGDVLGHSDGMIKFISSKRMFINDFSYEPDFLKKVEHEINQQDPSMKFVVLPSSYTDKGQYDRKIASARGLYINMLETKDTIYFPQYGLKNDQTSLEIVRKQTRKKVIPINVSKLSTTGGSIHCLTWDVSDQFRTK